MEFGNANQSFISPKGESGDYRPLFEFSQKLKISEQFLISQAKSGRLKAFLIDDYWVSRPVWVDEWLASVKLEILQNLPESTINATKINPKDLLLPEQPAAPEPDAAVLPDSAPIDFSQTPVSRHPVESGYRNSQQHNVIALVIGLIFLLGLVLLFFISLQL